MLLLASSDDMTALGLADLGVTPTECKDHLDQQAFLTNKRLGATEAMNLVITPTAFPIPPLYHAPHGTNVLEDCAITPSSKSVNGAFKHTAAMHRLMGTQVRVFDGYSTQSDKNEVFADSSWTTMGVDIMSAGGNDLCDSYYGEFTLLDDLSPLAIKARLLIEGKICDSHCYRLLQPSL